jgi:hypothetical protein
MSGLLGCVSGVRYEDFDAISPLSSSHLLKALGTTRWRTPIRNMPSGDLWGVTVMHNQIEDE